MEAPRMALEAMKDHFDECDTSDTTEQTNLTHSQVW